MVDAGEEHGPCVANATSLLIELLPWPKKTTIFEIRGEKNAVPRVISCSITRDQRREKVADSRGSDLALR